MDPYLANLRRQTEEANDASGQQCKKRRLGYGSCADEPEILPIPYRWYCTTHGSAELPRA